MQAISKRVVLGQSLPHTGRHGGLQHVRAWSAGMSRVRLGCLERQSASQQKTMMLQSQPRYFTLHVGETVLNDRLIIVDLKSGCSL